MDFSSINAAMKTCFNYSWDTAASIHRSNEFNFNCMQQIYNYQVNQEEAAPFPTRADFDAYAGWPGDRRPFYSEGAGPSGAGAGGGDVAGGSGLGATLGDDLGDDEEIDEMFE